MPKKTTEKKEQKIVDGFVVNDEGLVEMKLSINIEEDLDVKVTPDVAKRLMEGEFDDEDPGNHIETLGIQIDDIVNLRMAIDDVYETRPPRGTFQGVETGATGLDGDE